TQKTQLPKKQTMPMSLKGSTQKQDLNNMAMPMLKIAPAKTLQKSEPPKTVRYDLYVRDTIVNFTGKVKHAIAVNGQIPMPTLTFT
ncbi:hypothetical protein OZK63_41305, partial [Streptomyces sp. UMAF16]|nr:hypothetical protein [Streptomyces sp. UMAF16]